MTAILKGFVDVPHGQVHYRYGGRGPVVVMLHDSPRSSVLHASNIEWLGEHFTVIALDTPGYGNSTPLPQAQPEIPDFAAALEATLTALGIERCALYGFHTGAKMALQFAAEHPERVALTILDGLALTAQPASPEFLRQYLQGNQRVLIVDSDLRRPTLHKMMRVTNNLGLTNYLLKQNSLEEVIQTTGVPSLDFLASGRLPSSSPGILSSAAMKDLISELKQRYDYVFFDSPPIMGVSDASILASEVDCVLQVIQYRRYPQPMTIRAKQMIEKVGGNLLGIVLNNINLSSDENYYYYSGYYYDYYAKSEDSQPDKVADSKTSLKEDTDLEIISKY